MSTIRDIARAAGVSVSTASLALNGDARVRAGTRERVFQAASALEYHPMRAARNLSKGRSHALQLLNPMRDGDLSSSFFTRFVRGLHEVAHEARYTLAFTVLDDETEAMAQLERLVLERWADGVVLMNLSQNEALLERLVGRGVPHVLLGHSALPGVRSVDSDNVGVARDGAAHLLAQGRAPLLFLNGPHGHAFTEERAEGFRRAHLEAGLEPDASSVVFDLSTAEGARREVSALLAAGRVFSGLLASSDALALGALRALRDAGRRVPEEVAIVGINNDELCEYSDPPLTSVELNAGELGRVAGELLLAALAGAPSERRLVAHALVQRASS